MADRGYISSSHPQSENLAEERQLAYKVARDLYSLRSVIAHGSTPEQDRLRVAGEKLTLGAAAETHLHNVTDIASSTTASPSARRGIR